MPTPPKDELIAALESQIRRLSADLAAWDRLALCYPNVLRYCPCGNPYLEHFPCPHCHKPSHMIRHCGADGCGPPDLGRDPPDPGRDPPDPGRDLPAHPLPAAHREPDPT